MSLVDIDIEEVNARLDGERENGARRIRMAEYHYQIPVSRICPGDVSRRCDSKQRSLRLPSSLSEDPIRMALKQCVPQGQEYGEQVGSEIRDLCSTLYLALDAKIGVFRMEPRREVGVHHSGSIHCTLREKEVTNAVDQDYITNLVERWYPGHGRRGEGYRKCGSRRRIP